MVSNFLDFKWVIVIITKMRIPQIIDAFSVPKSNPPFAKGLVRKSPNVAPKGLVKIKAA